MNTLQTLRPVLSGLAASASLAGAVGGILFVAPEQADAQSSQPSASEVSTIVHQFNIASGTLSQVAGAFERTTGIHVKFAASSIESIQSPGVSGSFTAEQALRKMVDATGLRARAISPTMAVVDLIPVTTSVEVTASTNVLENSLDLGRLHDSLQNTPQTVTVIPQVMIEQQQATTVSQVLQYVPGITVSTGEGNGGVTGDQFRIRGFDASGDIYVDGLRDFGSYIRDSFATEDVMVVKGPSSESFGNGTTGGVIELDSKKAHLGDSSSLEESAGSGPYGRGVLDIDRQLNATTAVRVVGMVHGQDVVERDHVYAERWGVLGSVGFGLGTRQQVIVDYFHQQSKGRPDFGVPIPSNLPGIIAEPITEYGVSRQNYYGRDSDRDRQNADVATALYKGQFGDRLTLTNDSRIGHYARDLKFTPALCFDVSSLLSSIYGIPPGNCASDVAAGNLNTAYVVWPVAGNKTGSYGGENVTTALIRFHTGPFRHELVAGVDEYFQHAKLNFYIHSGPEPGGTLLNPIFQNSPGFSLALAPASQGTTAQSWDVGPFVSDRVWIRPGLSILGGVRWDHYNVHANAAGTPIDTSTQFASPKVSLIWQPTEQQNYYFSYGRSFTPPAQNITSFSSPLSLPGTATAPNLKPEGDTTYEFGGKWGLLRDRLGVTAALFRVDKSNASYIDPTSGSQMTTDDQERVQGVELGLTGKITHAWDVQASYSNMDGKIVSSSISTFTPISAAGNRVPYVSRNGVALWTTFDFATLIPSLSGHLLAGGGFNYRSNYFVDDANSLRIPEAKTADAMLSYDLKSYHLAFNVNNLSNALAYSSAFSNGYATPVAGRTFLFTIGFRLPAAHDRKGF